MVNGLRMTATILVSIFCAAGASAWADEAAQTDKKAAATTSVSKQPALKTAPPNARLKPALNAKPDLGTQAERLATIDQARGLKDVKDAAHAAAHLPSAAGSLTDPAGANLGRRNRGRFPSPGDAAKHPDNGGFKNPLGELAPDLPSNRDKTPNFGLAPSGNPRDWMRGASSNKTTSRSSHPTATDVITRSDNPDGSFTVRGVTYGPDGTFQNSDSTTYRSDNTSSTVLLERTRTIVDARTGETRIRVRETREERDANGNVTSRLTLPERDLGERKDPPATDNGGQGGIDRTIDPGADAHDGSLCAAMPWVCRGAPAKDPNQVNPGKDQGGFVSAPRINPGDSIVVNPALEHARQANQARRIDPDDAHRTVESGTHVNPPGPND